MRRKARHKSRTRQFGKAHYFAIAAIAAIAILVFYPASEEKSAEALSQSMAGKTSVNAEALKAEIFPEEGFMTKIVLGSTIPQLVETGAIDMEKFRQLYEARGGLTGEQLKLLTEQSSEKLTLTPENANFLLNILWPLGIANKNPILDETAQYKGVANLAATGGWTLGKENAMNYFNKHELVKLTPQQQSLLEKVSKSSYRPCCNNPSSFPDCNHGAAMLALLELGAAQGMTEEELYTLALQANTLWFPQQYLLTATLFELEGRDYFGSAREIMSGSYSSYSGWAQNVYEPLQQQGLLPKAEGGGSCGV